jgi:hypothetical protein
VVIPGVKIIECTIGDYENTTEISLWWYVCKYCTKILVL